MASLGLTGSQIILTQIFMSIFDHSAAPFDRALIDTSSYFKRRRKAIQAGWVSLL